MVLAATLSMLRYIGGSDDRDFVDRLHSYFTCNILIALSILVSFKQFGGKPIECLVPDMFSSSWEQYAENYCWAQDTYFVPLHAVAAGLHETEKRQRMISYYQWVPFFLLLEAACFRLPSLMWTYLSGHSGIKIAEIVKLSSDPNNLKPDIKRANIKSLTMHLAGALRFHKRLQKKQIRPHRFFFFCNLPYSAFFVTSVYIMTKLFYLINVVLQLLLMNKFLETSNHAWYGVGAIVDLLSGTSWKQSGVFPRVSLCDFDVRVMGNVQEHTIQCVLVINIFNEKIFIFLWFWFMGLLVFTLGSFLYWFGVSILPTPAKRFVARHLEMSDMPFDPTDAEAEKDVDRFVSSYLRSDGVFVLRMITLQSGVIFGTDLTVSLWKSYFGVEQLKRSNSMPGVAEGIKKDGGEGGSGGGGGGMRLPHWMQNEENEIRHRKATGGNDHRGFEYGTPVHERRDFDFTHGHHPGHNNRRNNMYGRDTPSPPTVPYLPKTRQQERIRLIPPPAPPPDFMRHVALLRGTGNLDDPNNQSIMVNRPRDDTTPQATIIPPPSHHHNNQNNDFGHIDSNREDEDGHSK